MRLIRFLCGPALVYAGAMHFIRPWFYKPMMPAWLPAHDELIVASGVTEIVAGAADDQHDPDDEGADDSKEGGEGKSFDRDWEDEEDGEGR